MYIDNHNYDPYYPGYAGPNRNIPAIFFRGKFHDWAPRDGTTITGYLQHDKLKTFCKQMNKRYAELMTKRS